MFEYGFIPPLMFAVMVGFLLVGFPVAFSLAAVGLMFGVAGVWMNQFDAGFLQALPLRFHAIVVNDLLLSIPFFTLMGALLERCRLAEDLLEGVGKLFGGLPGGVAFAVVLVGAVLGAITGTVAASVVAMGVISLPIMSRYGYNMRLATGVIAASGTITQLIPPSLVLIVLADQLGRSVGDMYLGAIGPSLLQVGVFLLFIVAVAIFKPSHMPPLPPEVRSGPRWKLVRQVLIGMLPAAGLMMLVLGTILAGLATPTESGAMGAVGAMLLAALNRRLSVQAVWDSCKSTMRITTMVIFILMGATVFTLVFQGMDGGHWVEHLLTGMPGGQVGFLLFVAAFIFVLAFFLDFFEIAFILIPLLAPPAKALGIDMVWFGVLVCVVMQTSFMHPPFGVALYYIRGIAPSSVKSSDIYLGAIPWILLQLLVVLIVVLWPQSVTYWNVQDKKLDDKTLERKLDSIGIPSYD
jgi:tripartite ATP-independent transporter DctM subunit